MCTYSMILDHGRRQWPQWDQPYYPPMPPLVPDEAETKRQIEALKKFFELAGKAKEYDTASGQPDCEDPEKVKIIDALEKRLAALEQEVKHLRKRNGKR